MFAWIAAGSLALTAALPLDGGPVLKTPLVAPLPRTGTAAGAAEHEIWGFVQSLTGTTLVVRDRRGAQIVVDTRLAHARLRVFPGRPVIVFGTTSANGIVHAMRVWRTFPAAARWPADRYYWSLVPYHFRQHAAGALRRRIPTGLSAIPAQEALLFRTLRVRLPSAKSGQEAVAPGCRHEVRVDSP